VIVFDTSTLVGTVMRPGGKPDRAFLHALRTVGVAVSDAMIEEAIDVMHRPRVARFLSAERRDLYLSFLVTGCTRFAPAVRVRDCRDPKDDKVLELALAAQAEAIVASDADLLVLHPWRGVPILLPADYLASAIKPG
jgi:putative PIN family toxin of toxin-antitoxin system